MRLVGNGEEWFCEAKVQRSNKLNLAYPYPPVGAKVTLLQEGIPYQEGPEKQTLFLPVFPKTVKNAKGTNLLEQSMLSHRNFLSRFYPVRLSHTYCPIPDTCSL